MCEHLGEGERMVYRIIFLVPLLHAHISMSALPPYPPGVTRVQGIMLHIRRVGRYLKVWHLRLL